MFIYRLLLSFVVAFLVWTAYLAWRRPILLDRPSVFHVPGPTMSFIAALIFGWGVALILMLAWRHRNRWRTVLRPTPARLLGALGLVYVLPFAIFGFVPWIVGGWAVFLVLIIMGSSGMPLVLIALVAPLLFVVTSIKSGLGALPGVAAFSGILLIMALTLDARLPLLPLALFVACYPVACLIVADTQNRTLRFARFCLMFCSAYAAILLWTGALAIRL